MRTSAGSVVLPPLVDGESLGGLIEQRPWNGTTDQPLEANILTIGTERPLVIVALDLLYPGALTPRIQHRLDSLLGGTPFELILCASHTHFGPNCSPEFPNLGTVSIRYLDDTADLIADTVVDLVTTIDTTVDSESADAWTCQPVRHSVARRRRPGWERAHGPLGLKWGVAQAPGGQINQCVTTWRSDQAVLWSFACHPTSYPELETVSPEYPGIVRSLLREAVGEEMPVLFLQGASGDIKQPHQSWDPRRAGALRFLLGTFPRPHPTFVTPTIAEWRDWSSELGRKVVRVVVGPHGHVGRQDTDPQVHEQRIPTSLLFEGEFPIDDVVLRAVRLFGATFLFVNAEVTTPLAEQISADWPDVHLVTCVDETIGYLCTPEEADAGGYEGRTWTTAFGLHSNVRRDAGTIVAGAAHELITACETGNSAR